MAEFYEQEGNTDYYQTEDGEGFYLLETSPVVQFNNYFAISAGNGISVTEKVF